MDRGSGGAAGRAQMGARARAADDLRKPPAAPRRDRDGARLGQRHQARARTSPTACSSRHRARPVARRSWPSSSSSCSSAAARAGSRSATASSSPGRFTPAGAPASSWGSPSRRSGSFCTSALCGSFTTVTTWIAVSGRCCCWPGVRGRRTSRPSCTSTCVRSTAATEGAGRCAAMLGDGAGTGRRGGPVVRADASVRVRVLTGRPERTAEGLGSGARRGRT